MDRNLLLDSILLIRPRFFFFLAFLTQCFYLLYPWQQIEAPEVPAWILVKDKGQGHPSRALGSPELPGVSGWSRANLHCPECLQLIASIPGSDCFASLHSLMQEAPWDMGPSAISPPGSAPLLFLLLSSEFFLM